MLIHFLHECNNSNLIRDTKLIRQKLVVLCITKQSTYY